MIESHAIPPRRFSNVERWGPVSQSLHWLIVVLILAMAALGLTMTDLPNSPFKIRLYNLHKSIGLTILVLVLLRVLWRAWAGDHGEDRRSVSRAATWHHSRRHHHRDRDWLCIGIMAGGLEL